MLDRGGVLLVRLPKGVLGEETTSLVGSLVLAQAWQAATARAHRPQHARPDASILIDECHNFLNLPYRIEDMLAEARGCRIGLTLAHQNLAQLPPELREGINTNARNKIMFSVSPDDATHLARHTLPELGPHDLAHLDASTPPPASSTTAPKPGRSPSPPVRCRVFGSTRPPRPLPRDIAARAGPTGRIDPSRAQRVRRPPRRR